MSELRETEETDALILHLIKPSTEQWEQGRSLWGDLKDRGAGENKLCPQCPELSSKGLLLRRELWAALSTVVFRSREAVALLSTAPLFRTAPRSAKEPVPLLGR